MTKPRDEHEQIHARGSWGAFIAYVILGLLDNPTEELLEDARSARHLLEEMTRLGTPVLAMEHLAGSLFRDAACRACVPRESFFADKPLGRREQAWENGLDEILEPLPESD